MIVAPHTSNWDFIVGLMAKLALGLGVRFLAKHTLFHGLLGAFLRWIGGIPVDRNAADGVVGEAIAEFRRREKLFLVITPEGTRKRVAAWKSGFYRIAEAAGVPILPVAFDYASRAVALGSLFVPTGDYEADLEVLRSKFRAEMALRPENY
jgi:1-acyl-sn-glycerol-3-phosphate acyltransferase